MKKVEFYDTIFLIRITLRKVNKMNIVPNYKNPKKYVTAKFPIRQPIYLTALIQLLSRVALIGNKYKTEKINMEGLKPPYIILSNHMAFVDFKLVSQITYPHRVNNVVNVDGFYKRKWLLEWIGAIGTRKFTSDIHLVRSILKCLERGDVIGLYPEACYSQCGISSYLPTALSLLIKKAGVPVVAVLHRGNHLNNPIWDVTKKRRVPLHTTATQILTREDISILSCEEIGKIVKSALTYDEYQYQKDNGILIKEEYRAEGLHKILYKCPSCKTEHKMASNGAEIYCEACGKRYVWQENGYLKALDGETEFDHIPDWFRWEKEEVRREIANGEYTFSDEVDVFSMPRTNKFIKLGAGKLTHEIENGFTLTGFYRGKEYRMERKPIQTYNLHIEYSYPLLNKGKRDAVVMSMDDDLFYCFPKKQNVITKLAFATQILYENRENEIKKAKLERRATKV